MVLSQQEAARIIGLSVPVHIVTMTGAGTLFVYGVDRWLERRELRQLADRHHRHPVLNALFVFVIVILTVYSLPRLHLRDLFWLIILGVLGLLYLLTTVGRLPALPLLKEVLGAGCFAVLILGHFEYVPPSVITAVGFTGLANFLWSSHQDRQRDAANGIRGLAVRYPILNIWLARGYAVTALVFFSLAMPRSLFGLVALFLLVWPKHARLSVDVTFLPLIAVFML
ncbi:MAG: hypothetical protein QNK37_30865 [Acidobacteriota bacterium]|nr:hypothetical protein [Acidobacteriota bacterium]